MTKRRQFIIVDGKKLHWNGPNKPFIEWTIKQLTAEGADKAEFAECDRLEAVARKPGCPFTKHELEALGESGFFTKDWALDYAREQTRHGDMAIFARTQGKVTSICTLWSTTVIVPAADCPSPRIWKRTTFPVHSS